ncbi:DEAD/DEAH box helicase [Microbulbifer yueqingensis]|uniref:Helicase conserved C-terminal domain-containing protein n=1 Tax=Microbulbifer yueqingensis TaxID=658219 RepID=A0A1G9DFG2_9GAMM|nr:DEAD/DEAH box helicase [Microbulbifer yueqingensis]SDK62609.1 Helicase conserved C-terminal domain-containing protein [Microbulbifer yueqingensis]
MKYFQGLVEQSISRAKQSTLSILGISDPHLRAHLAQQMSEELGAEGCFLAPPVFEHTFGWQPSQSSLASLAGALLEPELVKTLGDASGGYALPGHIHPYTHQLNAWRTLLDEEPKSAVVTSGTGSGKTECFMIPILNDLIRESKQATGPLVGVRALFLYPLNALINSQQERLDAWTRDYGEQIRFCLYNGNTEQSESKVRREQREHPNQVLSRERLRKEPSPILLTNSTMLEYMLVRQDDAPILEKSREAGSLRWIVLDEAHTYIGSQAAELSLLLRRVLHAFGRQAKDVRFVATSATIADQDAEAKLKTYLASLAGVNETQVVVIGGSRSIPELEQRDAVSPVSRDKILAIEPGEEVSPARYDALAHSDVASRLRNAIVDNGEPQTLDELLTHAKELLPQVSKQEQQGELLAWIDLMTGTKKEAGGEPFLKLRAHFLQRMLHGLWSCIDPQCPEKTAHLEHWPFGNLYVTERSRCTCSAPVYEVAFCHDCATPHLLAEDCSGYLHQRSAFVRDEFALTYEQAEGDEDPHHNLEDTITSDSQWIIASPLLSSKEAESEEQNNYIDARVDAESLEINKIQAERNVGFRHAGEDEAVCHHCGNSGFNGRKFYRQCYLGAPFYITNAVPTVLEYCPDPDREDLGKYSPEELPGRGRRLITFTDSRQGTARLAVKMQQEAERSSLRGLVFQVLRNRMADAQIAGGEGSAGTAEELEAAAKTVPDPAIKQLLLQQAEAARQQAAAPKGIVSFDDLTRELAASPTVSNGIVRYNRYTSPELFITGDEAGTMARLLLAREFARRPKNQNSTETLGLIRVGYQGLDSIKQAPPFWKETRVSVSGGENRALTLDDWRDFLKVALDFHVREHTYLELEDVLRNWMGARFTPKVLMSPKSEIVESPRVRKWPTAAAGPHRSRLIKLLELATDKDVAQQADLDVINAWLEKAWQDLINARILESHANGYALKFRKLLFSLPERAWECPVTGRLLDTTFVGLTPYLPRKYREGHFRCSEVELPSWTALEAAATGTSKLHSIRSAVERDEIIADLRSRNLWTDVSDRVVEGGYYYRTAEHSAQQSSEALKRYEDLFKRGHVNVLNCSTTMEMGVDIGGISAVVMNNVPPHPANYLQRAGRAGRRSEARAIAYTLCKKDPHNQRAFNNPKWPFVTAIPAPSITLSSDRIVQRHVHSLLLGMFLRKNQLCFTDNTKLNVKWFFSGEKDSPCHKFIAWTESLPKELQDAMTELLRGTSLASVAPQKVVAKSTTRLRKLQQRWVNEYQSLVAKQESATDEAYKRALSLELKRHEEEYLLRDLAARAYLPGYGFPTDVVNINTYNIEEFRNRSASKAKASREDNIYSYKEKPSRGLDVAIREYAPGSDIVIDGRVYRSAGVSLHWHSGGAINEAQKFDIAWQCKNCGASGVQENAFSNSDEIHCVSCNQAVAHSHKKTVLRPAGFLTDFYQESTNDISSQKFIRVERPRITVHGPRVALPDERLGYIEYGSEGTVFHHSSGEHEKGYAICMACGRAESMLASGEIPKSLQPSVMHRPLGGGKGADRTETCSGEKVMPNVYLGYQTSTDVLEVYLKNPQTGEWLPNTQEGQTIAATLAVALRDEIASRLGIASTEMGFSFRKDRDLEQGAERFVVQVYDKVSGGGGFCTAEVSDIGQLLKGVYQRLHCPAECDNVCSACLTGQDSRVEQESLDRPRALAWLKDIGLIEHLALPSCFATMPGAKHCAISPIEWIRSKLQSSADRITIRVPDSNVDVSHSDFRDMVLGWKVIDQVAVNLLLEPGMDVSDEFKHSLNLLHRLGVEVAYIDEAVPEQEFYMGIQVGGSDGVFTLVSQERQALVPGEGWLRDNIGGALAATDQLPSFMRKPLPSDFWETNLSGARVIEFSDELNGRVINFPTRFAQFLQQQVPTLKQQFANEQVVKISYYDRYLKSPWMVLLLEKLLASFPSKECTVEIQTLAANSDYSKSFIDANWCDPEDQREAIAEWIGVNLKASVDVHIEDRPKAMSHGRILILEWSSGKTTKILLDQGVGYWDKKKTKDDRFNFRGHVAQQLEQIQAYQNHASMINSAPWPTYITVITE